MFPFIRASLLETFKEHMSICNTQFLR